MSFLGEPCPCGWAFSETENGFECERCGRDKVNKGGYWSVGNPKYDVPRMSTPEEKRAYIQESKGSGYAMYRDMVEERE